VTPPMDSLGWMDPKDIVRTGYDAVSIAYRSDDDADDEYGEWLAEIAPGLAAGARVLDLGCGCGIPSDRWLVEHGFDVTGVDFSPVQIERARRLVPQATFVAADIASIEFSDCSFDAVIALYSIFHLPLDEQRTLIGSVRRWLGAGGQFLVILPAGEWTGTEENWLGAGATMWWSEERPEVYDGWLTDAGFDIRWRRFVPEGDAGHDLVLAVAGGAG
jgi:ubiquinone/menaquinone biosynthesis C-methylase UbiE